MWLSLLLAASATVGIGEAKPGTGTTPAFVCVGTTITKKGHTDQSHVVNSSGNPKSDQRALRVVRKTRFTREKGHAYEEQDALIVVKIFANGQFGIKVMEPNDELMGFCDPSLERPELR